MTFDFVILPDLRFIALRYTGDVGTADVIRCSEKLWTAPLYDKTYKGIVDLTGVTMTAPPHEVGELIAFYKRPETSIGRWAVVTSEPKVTALSLLFRSSSHASPWIEVFTSWENACAFLDVKVDRSIFGAA